jgi:hypothetical protein
LTSDHPSCEEDVVSFFIDGTKEFPVINDEFMDFVRIWLPICTSNKEKSVSSSNTLFHERQDVYFKAIEKVKGD